MNGERNILYTSVRTFCFGFAIGTFDFNIAASGVKVSSDDTKNNLFSVNLCELLCSLCFVYKHISLRVKRS